MIEAIKNISFLSGSIAAISFFAALIGFVLFWRGHSRKSNLDMWTVATEIFTATLIIALIIEIFFATSPTDLAIKTLTVALVLPASFFLMRSVRGEIESKRKIESLLADLSAVNEELKVLDAQKSEFLYLVAHQLREPLTFINSTASMVLKGSSGQITDATKGALERIFESGKRLMVIINDFLDITSIERGEMKYEFSITDIRAVASDVVTDMKLNAKNAGLEIELHIEDEASPTSDAEKYDPRFTTTVDQGKIRQVLSNLIDNSIKYTPKGRVDIYVSSDDVAKKIVIRITDTGIGLSSETLAKIFNKFSRAEGVSKVYTEGSGLGLYVAREIMKKHRGRVFAESAGAGEGSSFILELPREEK
jgi:signal transduction histidine kinase